MNRIYFFFLPLLFFSSFSISIAATYTFPNEAEINSISNSEEFATEFFMVNDSILNVDSVYCITDTIELEFKGNIFPGSEINWEFADANEIGGSGVGPILIKYDTPGNKRIEFVLIEDGDTIRISREFLIVGLPDPPVLICDTRSMPMTICIGNGGITPGPTLINVSGINGTTGRFDGTCFMAGTISDNGTTIDIQYTVEGEIPGCDLIATYQCDIVDCPPVEMLPVDPGTLCLTSNAAPQPLIANVLNNLSNGTLTWSGNFVSPDGLFDYTSAGAGNHTVTVTYEEDGCSWTESLTVKVSESPQIFDFSIRAPLFYNETLGEITVETVASGNYTYNWFTASAGTIGNERSVRIPNWQAGTNYCVEISNQDGCKVADCVTAGGPVFRVSPLYVICEGSSTNISIRPGNGAAFRWSPSNGLSCTDCPDPTANPTTSTQYTIRATLPDGRFGATTVYVIVIPRIFCTLRLQDEEIEAAFRNSPNDPDAITKALIDKLVAKNNASIGNDLSVFPNPTNGIINVSSELEVLDFEISNPFGQIINRGSQNAKNFSLDLHDQPSGYYILRAKVDNGWIMKRLIKQ